MLRRFLFRDFSRYNESEWYTASPRQTHQIHNLTSPKHSGGHVIIHTFTTLDNNNLKLPDFVVLVKIAKQELFTESGFYKRSDFKGGCSVRVIPSIKLEEKPIPSNGRLSC